MAGTPITGEPELIFVEDTAGGASCSEAMFSKNGATSNFILNEFNVFEFGVDEIYSGLASFPAVVGSLESARMRFNVEKIYVYSLDSGLSGQTEFRIEKQLAAGGSWTNIFTTNCIISNTAADDLRFVSGGTAPSGVTLPVFPTTTLEVGDKLRFVLVTAADQADTLHVDVALRPIN